MAVMTITEALAMVKVIESRIEKKRTFIMQYLMRPATRIDPLDNEAGGSRGELRRQEQSVNDLERDLLQIRRAIQEANRDVRVRLEDREQTVADWLVWRREIAPRRLEYYRNIIGKINAQRNAGLRTGAQVTTEETKKEGDVIVNLDERALADEIERLDRTLGTLDGQLSLKNATVMVDVPTGD